MSERSDPSPEGNALRNQIIGLGARSLRKSYYPQLQRQVEELRAARQRAEEEEQKFRTLFEGITDGVVVADKETRQLLKVNPAFCQMLGYTEAELLQLSLPDIHPPEELPRLMEDLERLDYGISALIQDRPFKRKDGSIFCTEINAISIDIENRRCALGVCRDTAVRSRRFVIALQKIQAVILQLPQKPQHCHHNPRQCRSHCN